MAEVLWSKPRPYGWSALFQTPAIWLKFSDPNPGHMAEVLWSKPRPHGWSALFQTPAIWLKFTDPNPGHMAEVPPLRICSDPCNHSLIQRGAEGRRKSTFLALATAAATRQRVRRRLGGEDGDGPAARTAAARRLPPACEAPKRSQFRNTFGISKLNSVIYRSNFIQTPAIWLKFSDLNPGHMAEALCSKPRPYGWSSLIQTPAIWLKFSDPNPGHMAEALCSKPRPYGWSSLIQTPAIWLKFPP